jgi:hypothetical protein
VEVSSYPYGVGRRPNAALTVDKEVEGNEGVARNDALDIVVVDKSVKKVRNPNAVKHVEKASGQVSERPKKLSEKPKNSEHVIVSSTQVTPKKDVRDGDLVYCLKVELFSEIRTSAFQREKELRKDGLIPSKSRSRSTTDAKKRKVEQVPLTSAPDSSKVEKRATEPRKGARETSSTKTASTSMSRNA